MQLEHLLAPFRRRCDIDVTLFTNSDLIAQAVHHITSSMRIERQVVQPTVRQSIAVVPSVLHLGDEADFREIGNAFVRAAAATQARNLEDQGCRNNFVVFAALLDLPLALAFDLL